MRCANRLQLAVRRSRIAARLADDSGAAGLVIALIIMVVASTALMVFFRSHIGPTHDLEKLQAAKAKEKYLEAGLMAYFNQSAEVPCPDSDQDGDEDACSGGSTTSGTLPWITMGLSRDDAIDAYGTFYTYVVADAAQELCVSVPNDYNSGADAEFTGEVVDLDDLQVIETTDGATGRYVPYAIISHGKNRLGGISATGNAAIADPPDGSNELVNATANPTTIYTGPYDSDADTYFDDTVWAPATSDLADACEQKTEGGALNADLTEDFAGADGDVDQTKFDTSNPGTEVQQEAGQAVFSDETAYMTTAASNVLNSTERPLYISADWTPDSAAANGGFSIVTRAEATPTAGVFDPGITFRFFGGTGAAGNNTISIMDNGAQVTGFSSDDDTFTMTFGETYLLEVFDNGDEVWMQISQKNLQSNRAYAYATGITGDTDGTRIAFVNGTTSESRIDNIVAGRPMMAMDTYGTGHAQASGNGENYSTTGTVTLEGWFKPRSLPTGGNTATLISQWDSNQLTRSTHRLFMSSGGALSLSLGDGTNTDTEELGVSLEAGEWTHLAVMYDDEATYGEITVYVNGEHANTITGTVDSQILSGNPIRTGQEQFMVGADHAGVNSADATGNFSQNIYDGQVSDVRVWDDVRTATEIAEWYDRRLPIADADPALDNLVVNWRFDRESGGFGAVQVEDSPASIGADGDILHDANWVGALLNTHRTTSTDVCDGFRVGAFRCDYRDPVANLIISGSDLGGIATLYIKVWGAGGGSRVNSGVLVHTGGGGGYAAGLLLNTGQDLRVNVGAGGAGGVNANGTAGAHSLLEQNTMSDRARGNGGGRGTNAADGAGGTGVANAALLTSVVASGVGVVPGCNPANDPCNDEHYTTTGAPTDEVGRGGDDESTPDGRDGAIVLLW